MKEGKEYKGGGDCGRKQNANEDKQKKKKECVVRHLL